MTMPTAATIARPVLTVLVGIILAACGGGESTSTPPPASVEPPPPVTTPVTIGKGVVTLQTSAFVDSTLSATTIGPAGGVLTVTGASDPLAGARIDVPAGVLTETTNVGLGSASVSSVTGLPDGATARGRVVHLQLTSAATGAGVGALQRLVRITLPVDASTTDAIAYYQVESGGSLEAMGFDSIDATSHAITFVTRAPGLSGTVASVSVSSRPQVQGMHVLDTPMSPLFATYVAIGVAQTTLSRFASSQVVLDTGFKPSLNGFSILNDGSYYADSGNGNCFGMVGFAKYYYQMGFASPLADTYRDAQKTATWIDDSVAIELASRVHNQMLAIWSIYGEELDQQTSWTAVGQGIIGALYVTGRPTLVYLRLVVNGGGNDAHAVAAYKATFHTDGTVSFGIYDPNFQKDDTRALSWSVAGGFDNYASGPNAAASALSYNFFKQMGFSMGLTPDELARDKSDADAGYPSSVFPTITITSITGQTLGDDVLANTGTTPQGQTDYVTGDTAVVIEGTVLGGNAQVEGQVVNNLNIFSPDGNLQQTDIDNQAGGGTGHFRVVVPIKSGVNPIALLASDAGETGHWAAFKEIYVESSSAPKYLTATLTWDQGTSDVDLYVKEPDGAAGTADAGKTGDIVFWAHRAGASTTNAYLDFDNTDGFGPENYIVKPGLKTEFTDGSSAISANGTYTVGVHYFGWNGDDDAPDRSIGWTVKWRLLKSCNNGCANPETDGLWVTGSQSGRIAHDDDSQAGPAGFSAGGSAWSDKFQIAFPAATTSWTVPPSNTIMLP